MFTTGSKLLVGSAVVAALFAVAYGLSQEGILGTIGLASAAVALAFLAGVNIAVRDSTVPADDANAVATAASARRAPAGSLWPFIAALGLTTIAVGFITSQAFVVVGIALLLGATAEWLVQAWSERASEDDAFNDEIRERFASPLELPILAAAGLGVVIYGFSRVMLSLSKSGTVAVFATVAALLLLVAFLFAARPKVSSGTVAGVSVVAAIALVAGGTVAGVGGERELHEHETTADIAERGECGEEETEADEEASQTVSAKASLSATLILQDDGQLVVDVPGYDAVATTLTLPRSNANNILFRNETPEHRRLVIADVPVGDGSETKTFCTALVAEGGVQLLTISFPKPSFATESGYQATVPGVEAAVVEVVVP
jgi:hypothetical protein